MTAPVSVVIPVRNRREEIVGAVRSVLEQSLPPSEIIVVDDGSRDGSAEVLEAFGAAVRVLRLPGCGVSAARNAGWRAAAEPWVAFLDSDDRWLPQKLERQVAFHREHPEFLVSQTEEIWVRKGRRVNPCRYHAKPEGDIFLPSLERCLVSPSAVMMSRDLLEEAGGFDPEFPVCEDYDLWLRLAVRHRFGLVRERLVVKYGGHADQLSRRYWGMDRYRILSLARLLEDPSLDAGRRAAVVEVLRRKCAVVARGARRRGRLWDARRWEILAETAPAAACRDPNPRAEAMR